MSYLSILLLLVSIALSSTLTQTDWSGGAGVQGPVFEWGDTFWNTDGNINFTSGELRLLSIPIPVLKHSVVSNFNNATSVYAADIDDDGDIDVLGAGGNSIAWWENSNGTGAIWIEHTVDNNIYNAKSIYCIDIDGDGDLDILVVNSDNDVTWWENIDGMGTAWTKHIIDEAFYGGTSVCPEDIDSDGDIDVLGARFPYDNIVWWENTDGVGLSWSKHSIDSDIGDAQSVYSTDINGDGYPDALGASYNDNGITWWENSGGTGTIWTEHAVYGSFGNANSVYANDMDGDGDSDVLGAGQNAECITWWENSDGTGLAWVKHVVDDTFLSASSVHSADVDGDGDADILGTCGGYFIWWENTDGIGTGWEEHAFVGDFYGAASAFAADIDKDGDTDLLAAAHDIDEIAWWNVVGFVDTGALESSILDTGEVGDWDLFNAAGLIPSGTSIAFQFRSSQDYTNMGAWSDTMFSTDISLNDILDDSTMFLQYKVILETTVSEVSPELQGISFEYIQGVGESGSGEMSSWSLRLSENPSLGFFSALVSVSEAGVIELFLYDVSGRVVAEVSEELSVGMHLVDFDGLTEGVYFCTMQAEGFSTTERVIVLR